MVGPGNDFLQREQSVKQQEFDTQIQEQQQQQQFQDDSLSIQQQQQQDLMSPFLEQGPVSLDLQQMQDGSQFQQPVPMSGELSTVAVNRMEEILENKELSAESKEEIKEGETLLRKESKQQVQEKEKQQEEQEEKQKSQQDSAFLKKMEELQRQLNEDTDSASESFRAVKDAMTRLMQQLNNSRRNDVERGEALAALRSAAMAYYNSHRGFRWSRQGKRRKELVNQIIENSQEMMVDEAMPEVIRGVALKKMMTDNSENGINNRQAKTFFAREARRGAVKDYKQSQMERLLGDIQNEAINQNEKLKKDGFGPDHPEWVSDEELQRRLNEAKETRGLTDEQAERALRKVEYSPESFRLRTFASANIDRYRAGDAQLQFMERIQKSQRADERTMAAYDLDYRVKQTGKTISPTDEPLTEEDARRKLALDQKADQLISTDFHVRKQFIHEWMQQILDFELKPEMLTEEYILGHFEELLRLGIVCNHFGDNVDSKKAPAENQKYYESLPKELRDQVELHRRMLDAVTYSVTAYCAKYNVGVPPRDTYTFDSDKEEEETYVDGTTTSEARKRIEEMQRKFQKTGTVDASIRDLVEISDEIVSPRDPLFYTARAMAHWENSKDNLKQGLNVEDEIRKMKTGEGPFQSYSQHVYRQAENFRKTFAEKYKDLHGLADEAYSNAAHLDEMNALVKKWNAMPHKVEDADYQTWKVKFGQYRALINQQTQMSVEASILYRVGTNGEYAEDESGKITRTQLPEEESQEKIQRAQELRAQEEALLEQIKTLHNELAQMVGLEQKESIRAQELWKDQQENGVAEYAGFTSGRALKVTQINQNDAAMDQETRARLDAFYDKFQKATGVTLNANRLFQGFFRPLLSAMGEKLDPEEEKLRKEQNAKIMTDLENAMEETEGGQYRVNPEKFAAVLTGRFERLLDFSPELMQLPTELQGMYGEEVNEFSMIAMMITEKTPKDLYGTAGAEIENLIPKELLDFALACSDALAAGSAMRAARQYNYQETSNINGSARVNDTFDLEGMRQTRQIMNSLGADSPFAKHDAAWRNLRAKQAEKASEARNAECAGILKNWTDYQAEQAAVGKGLAGLSGVKDKELRECVRSCLTSQSTAERAQKLISKDDDTFCEEMEKVFDEFLAEDLSLLDIGSDLNLQERGEEKIRFIQKGSRMNTLLDKALQRGMYVPYDRLVELRTRANACQDAAADLQAAYKRLEQEQKDRAKGNPLQAEDYEKIAGERTKVRTGSVEERMKRAAENAYDQAGDREIWEYTHLRGEEKTFRVGSRTLRVPDTKETYRDVYGRSLKKDEEARYNENLTERRLRSEFARENDRIFQERGKNAFAAAMEANGNKNGKNLRAISHMLDMNATQEEQVQQARNFLSSDPKTVNKEYGRVLRAIKDFDLKKLEQPTDDDAVRYWIEKREILSMAMECHNHVEQLNRGDLSKEGLDMTEEEFREAYEKYLFIGNYGAVMEKRMLMIMNPVYGQLDGSQEKMIGPVAGEKSEDATVDAVKAYYGTIQNQHYAGIGANNYYDQKAPIEDSQKRFVFWENAKKIGFVPDYNVPEVEDQYSELYEKELSDEKREKRRPNLEERNYRHHYVKQVQGAAKQMSDHIVTAAVEKHEKEAGDKAKKVGNPRGAGFVALAVRAGQSLEEQEEMVSNIFYGSQEKKQETAEEIVRFVEKYDLSKIRFDSDEALAEQMPELHPVVEMAGELITIMKDLNADLTEEQQKAWRVFERFFAKTHLFLMTKTREMGMPRYPSYTDRDMKAIGKMDIEQAEGVQRRALESGGREAAELIATEILTKNFALMDEGDRYIKDHRPTNEEVIRIANEEIQQELATGRAPN